MALKLQYNIAEVMMDFLKKLAARWSPEKPVTTDQQFFNDPVPKGMMSNEYIMASIFDADYILYNLGYNAQKDSFKGLLQPLAKRVKHDY